MLGDLASEPPRIEAGIVHVPIGARRGAIAEAVKVLDAGGIGVDDIGIHRPTLDDVFIALTGRAAEPVEEQPAESAPEGR